VAIVIADQLEQLHYDQERRIASIPETINGDRLRRRERETLSLVMEGRQNGEIAIAMGISLETVKTHIVHMLKRTGARNRLQLSVWAAIAQTSDSLPQSVRVTSQEEPPAAALSMEPQFQSVAAGALLPVAAPELDVELRHEAACTALNEGGERRAPSCAS